MEFQNVVRDGIYKGNILQSAIHPTLGLVWTDGETVYLSAIKEAQSPSMQNAKTLGKFRHVISCSWSPTFTSLDTPGSYLAVQQKTCLTVWNVRENPDGSLEFNNLCTLDHSSAGKGCFWHPSKLLLIALTSTQAILFDLDSGCHVDVHRGSCITAGCWTLDGHHFLLAEQCHLHIFTMGQDALDLQEKKTTCAMLPSSSNGSVRAMTPVSDHVVAMATELPLERIVMAMPADLFTLEDNRDIVSDDTQDRKGDNDLSVDGVLLPVKTTPGLHSRVDLCIADEDQCHVDCESERDLLKTSDDICKNGAKQICLQNPSTNSLSSEDGLSVPRISSPNVKSVVGADKAGQFQERRSHTRPKRIVDDVLKRGKGPIDLTEILSQGTDGQSQEDIKETYNKVDQNKRHRTARSSDPDGSCLVPAVLMPNGDQELFDKRSDLGHCIDMNKKSNGEKNGEDDSLLDAGNQSIHGEQKSRCAEGYWKDQKELIARMCKNVHEQSISDPVVASNSSSLYNNRNQYRGAAGVDSCASPMASKVIDLTSMKSSSSEEATAPKLKYSQQPGIDSCAKLLLFSLPPQKFLEAVPLEGVINPSLVLYHKEKKVLIIGSHSRRTLTLYSCNGTTVKKIPHVIELEEVERPVGMVDIPSESGSILVAVTNPISQDGGMGSVLPASHERKRTLSLKTVSLPTGSLHEIKHCNSSTMPESTHQTICSPVAGADNGLPQLLLPGGGMLESTQSHVGMRVGIEELEQSDTQGSDERSKVNILRQQHPKSNSVNNDTYPSPENAEFVHLELKKNSKESTKIHKTFLLETGLLHLPTVKDVFNLSHVEMLIGDQFVILTSNRDGFVPLRFSSNTRYIIQEGSVNVT